MARLMVLINIIIVLVHVQPVILVSLHDQAVTPVSGVMVTLRQSNRVVAHGTTDGRGALMLPAPLAADGTLFLTVQGALPDGSPIATAGDGLRVFVQGDETVIPLRVDVGGVVIPDPFGLGEIATSMDGTVIPVAPTISTAINPRATPIAVGASAAHVVSEPFRSVSSARLVVLVLGLGCFAVALVVLVIQRGRP